LVKRAEIYAAQHNTSIAALVRELLEQAVSGEARNRATISEFLAIGKRARANDDPGNIQREELHERW
jgi:plasmid stability protein